MLIVSFLCRSCKYCFSLAIALTVFLRFMAADYLFDIFKLLFLYDSTLTF
jgi:hypothetical protein